MNNLWLNVRFLFWHLQCDFGSLRPSIVRNDYLWRNAKQAWARPFAVYDFCPREWRG